MTTYVGVDPDLHRCSFAVFWPSGNKSVFLVTVERELKDRKAMIEMCRKLPTRLLETLYQINGEIGSLVAAVEGQEFLVRGNAPLSDIGMLSAVSGAAIGSFPELAEVLCPKPVEWKGSVPKHIHHARIGRELGFDVEIKGGTGKNAYGVPKDKEMRQQVPLASDWKHCMDALGLALWARKKHREGPR